MLTNTTPGNYYPQEPTPDLVLVLPPSDAIGRPSNIHPEDLADHKFTDASTYNSDKMNKFLSREDQASTNVLRLTHDPASDEKIYADVAGKLGILSYIQTIQDADNQYKYYNFGKPDKGSLFYDQPIGLVTTIIAGKLQSMTLTRGVLTPVAQAALDANIERKLAADAKALQLLADAAQSSKDLQDQALQRTKADHQSQLERMTPNLRKRIAPENIKKVLKRALQAKPKDPNDPFRG